MIANILNQLGKYKGLTYMIDDISKYPYRWDNMYKYGMVLLGPDSFRQKEVNNILEFFNSKGFGISAIKIKRINRTQAENLFLPTSTCMECGTLKWWMIQDSASLGEFAAVIFYSPTATPEVNCLKQLNKLKGHSNPLKNTNGVVRHDFKAINVCLNLIHIPDTFGDFFKDTSAFYNIDELAEIVNQPVDIMKDYKEMFKDKLFLCELYSRNTSDYIFEKIVYKIKYLLADALEYDSDEVNSLKEHYMEMYNVFGQLDTYICRYDMLAENISKEIEMINECQKLFLDKIEANRSNLKNINNLVRAYSIADLLNVITDPRKFKSYENEYFLQLRASNVHIEPFEQLIINTSLMQWQ